MFYGYKKAINFYYENKFFLLISLLAAMITFPLKTNSLTILGGFAISMFFAGGFAGMVANRGKIKMGLKGFVFQSAKNYGSVCMSLVESFFISVLNFLLVLFFGILPMIILQVSPNAEYSKVVLTIMFLIVLMYRIPLFMYSFSVSTLNRKEYGKYGVAKIKKIIWENSKFWFNSIFQLLLYSGILILQYIFFDGNVLMYTILDILKAMLFTFFIVANVFYFDEIVNRKEEYKETVDQYNYKENPYSTLSGRFLM